MTSAEKAPVVGKSKERVTLAEDEDGIRGKLTLDEEVVATIAGLAARAVDGIHALGKSQDPAALRPLLDALASGDTILAGFAAHALGDLGDPAAEGMLIEAAAADGGWVTVNACWALGRIGTRRALPVLQWFANGPPHVLLNRQGAARAAIERIEERIRKQPV